MSVQIVFETHATSEDNEAGLASGWLPGRLSKAGRQQASRLGRRRRQDGLAAVFCSDLQRAVETAQIAFGNTDLKLFYDWRLRECDYGDLNGAPAELIHQTRQQRLRTPYPGGESWEQAVRRVRGTLDDLARCWSGARVLLVGHVATRWALDHFVASRSLAELAATEFTWHPGWEYRTDELRVPARGRRDCAPPSRLG
ncbi:MAG TPA: histidine phosphatase family protein [Nocardioidaceae bacterium]|nr:histidine phosphatase family protein [Nocardioidaceae bacterium]